MWNRYDFTPFLGLGLGVIHRSSMYAALDNTVLLPGFTRMDADVRATQQGHPCAGKY
jgi:catecholate siderophore receptor